MTLTARNTGPALRLTEFSVLRLRAAPVHRVLLVSMNRIAKIGRVVLFTVGALAGVMLLAGLAVVLFVDVNDYKPRVEAAASSAFGMAVSIEGNMGVSFAPGLRVTLENVRINNRGTELAAIQEVDVGILLLPLLLQQQIHYGSVKTKGARIYLERSRDGIFNFQKTPVPGHPARPLDLPKVIFSDVNVVFADKESGNNMAFDACEGDLADLKHPGGAPFLKRISLNGKVTCATMRNNSKSATDLKFDVVATDGIFDLKPITLLAYGGNGMATMRIDRSVDVPTTDLDFKLDRFHVEQYFKPKPSAKHVSGRMDFTMKVAMQGRGQAMRRSATGVMTLSGNNLTLNGVNLDAELPKFASSQDFNLLDLGAVLFAGPVGLAVTKGYELTSLTQRADGSTSIRTAVSKWKIDKGVAYAQDVALVTPQNRLALQGGLDFVDKEYRDVVVALVDEYGCATVRQKISGPFNKPAVDKSHFLIPLGAVVRLIEKTKSLLTGREKCEAFYSGSLPPPKAMDKTKTSEKVAGAARPLD